MPKLFVCVVCGFIAFDQAPQKCPICGVGPDKFKPNDQAINPAEKEGKEKHVPVLVAAKACGLIPGVCQDVHVKVGSVPHPMLPEHHIDYIDVYLNHRWAARYHMAPDFLQAAVSIHFKSDQTGTVTAIEHCNLHGYWMAEINI
jgi:superoxide reductase